MEEEDLGKWPHTDGKRWMEEEDMDLPSRGRARKG